MPFLRLDFKDRLSIDQAFTKKLQVGVIEQKNCDLKHGGFRLREKSTRARSIFRPNATQKVLQR